MKNLTFNDFAVNNCDKLYTPDLPHELQSTGYKLLHKMVSDQIAPATKEECIRWESSPTVSEILKTPDIKYLRFLHPNLREFVQNNWDYIKKLEL